MNVRSIGNIGKLKVKLDRLKICLDFILFLSNIYGFNS